MIHCGNFQGTTVQLFFLKGEIMVTNKMLKIVKTKQYEQ
jgi:hypothetical protein